MKISGIKLNKFFTYGLLSLLIFRSFSSKAQITLDSAINANKNKWIDVSLIEGEWESMDTLQSDITFVRTKYDLQLLPKIHINPYSFNSKDSTQVSAQGVAISWPPFYCVISYVSEQHLEIIYYDFANTSPAIYYYKRKKTLKQ